MSTEKYLEHGYPDGRSNPQNYPPGSNYPGGPSNPQDYPPGSNYPGGPSNPQNYPPGSNYPGGPYVQTSSPQYYPQQPGQNYPGGPYGHTSTNVVTVQPGPGVIIQQPADVPTTKGHVALGLSIFMCIFFCWPLGIAAIIFAVQSMNSSSVGNAPGAHRSANISLGLSIAGIVCGIIIIVVVVVQVTRVTSSSITYYG